MLTTFMTSNDLCNPPRCLRRLSEDPLEVFEPPNPSLNCANSDAQLPSESVLPHTARHHAHRSLFVHVFLFYSLYYLPGPGLTEPTPYSSQHRAARSLPSPLTTPSSNHLATCNGKAPDTNTASNEAQSSMRTTQAPDECTAFKVPARMSDQ
jgi:hypothetical protein